MKKNVILFIHGFATGPAVWQQQMDMFKHDHLIVTNSDHILAHESVYIIAWSMGAWKAFKLYQDFPHKVKGLILVSAFPKYLKSANYPQGIEPVLLQRLEKKFRQDYKTGMQYFYELVFKDKQYHHLIDTLPQPPEEDLLRWFEGLKNYDWREFLPEIKVPTLLIHGDQDTITLPASSEYMKEKIPNSQLVVFKGVGHTPFLEQPDKFHDLVRGFISNNG
ncbi:hypothetical protein A2291_01370 [candidate division WOR-1 bacterium RIFOXYB2_FULL_42_35]|uniref:AB hydrolase-1 domain-containing protein n=1 Tax=candidate division WOR-1 bacterium RIFOXYC2_FULL_41_25 TaxID=1802586 RepID=A0A1F4TL67_UNCSA|nr:MAG: hypothetical protein A2247_04795 [candidate division WOR-1 bacterium RIFOXYA2_FULL_41_14]OGC22955.1 MAG: hypothetical protein A2291_01370 [candidate division WOR-1 bacterium RIFOXYB2_FULL_42_35]OGC33436.1 MAG: hypothetical protein A2462_06760 [candidate division WOR-1 bacterium RIFOXYC2_FULL_41_25]